MFKPLADGTLCGGPQYIIIPIESNVQRVLSAQSQRVLHWNNHGKHCNITSLIINYHYQFTMYNRPMLINMTERHWTTCKCRTLSKMTKSAKITGFQGLQNASGFNVECKPKITDLLTDLTKLDSQADKYSSAPTERLAKQKLSTVKHQTQGKTCKLLLMLEMHSPGK